MHLDLGGLAPAGGRLTYVIDDGGVLGQITSAGADIDYTARADAADDDTLLVRAVNASFGSDQVNVTVHVLPALQQAAPTPTVVSQPKPLAKPAAAAISSWSLKRLRGLAGKRARLARLTVRGVTATTVTVRVSRLPVKSCKAKNKKRCPKAVEVTTVKAKLKQGKATITITLKGRRAPKGRYTFTLTPAGAAGTGKVVTRRFTVS